MLVSTLIAHCKTHSEHVIDLWTTGNEPGKLIYSTLGLNETQKPGIKFENIIVITKFIPDEDQIRMRLEI